MIDAFLPVSQEQGWEQQAIPSAVHAKHLRTQIYTTCGGELILDVRVCREMQGKWGARIFRSCCGADGGMQCFPGTQKGRVTTL